MTRSFDAIVIGGGPAGEVAAGRLAGHGLQTALVESELIGGECSYWACMPSKALLRPAQALAEAARVGGARERVPDPRPDPLATLARRDEVVHGLDDSGQQEWLADRGVAFVRGYARLAGERRVRVGDEVLEARRAVVIATGSRSDIPPIPGLADAEPWTTRQGTTAAAVPDRLVVLGGGPAGCELAQAWATLGSAVTLVEAAPSLLGREEPFASQQVREGLEAAGVRVIVGERAARVTRDGDVVVELESDERVAADEILVASGRAPRTDDLGLGSVGLADGEPLQTDDRLRAGGCKWLFCVGDANGRAPLTHEGKRQARIAADVIAGDEEVRLEDHGPPPRVVFTEPQVAAVGHTLAGARDAGIDAECVDQELAAIAGASFHGREAPGTCRLVLDRGAGVVAGATFTGPDVAELLHAATIAVAARVPIERLWESVPAFPTRSEVWLRLLERAGC